MTLMQSCSWRAMGGILSAIGLTLLAACASPATRFYTLGTDARSTITGSTGSPSFRIDVRPVKVPAAVARSQLVVQDSATQVKVLEQDRWASSLPDEIHDALIAGVSQQAGVPAANTVARDGNSPVYEVDVSFQRFESWPGSHVLIDVVWNVRTSAGAGTLTCHSVVSEQVSDGYQAIVDGHRHAISAVAEQIAEVVRELGGPAPSSPFKDEEASRAAGKTALSCPQFAHGTKTGQLRASRNRSTTTTRP
ncbi:protein of unknown function DUF330 [Burkholderia sp. H160]|nr:protein of unknown function DUF330 [Burkholderia sp. H160]